jgi:hypothetical protein
MGRRGRGWACEAEVGEAGAAGDELGVEDASDARAAERFEAVHVAVMSLPLRVRDSEAVVVDEDPSPPGVQPAQLPRRRGLGGMPDVACISSWSRDPASALV